MVARSLSRHLRVPDGFSRAEQERELLDKNRENAAKGKAGRGLKKPAAEAKGAKGAGAQGMLNVDYVDEPILDVLRAIATAFKLSIIPDKDLGDVKVTIHLENIPVLEGLEKLCKSHGLELIADGNVYRIRKARVIPEDEIHFVEEAPIVLTDRERERFLHALDHPPKPNSALRRLMAGKAAGRL